MKYTRLIGTVIAFCMAVPLFAQQYKATIPYRIVGEKMVIEMKVNGNARPFIFDTGGRTALTTKACQALQITATDSMKVTDVNNVESYYKTTRIENLTTPDDVINFKNAPSLIINEVKGWECFGVDGIIGSDLFASTIVSIDSQTKNIIVTSAGIGNIVSGNFDLVKMFLGLACLTTALSTPKLLAEFLVPSGPGGGAMSKIYAVNTIRTAVKSFAK